MGNGERLSNARYLQCVTAYLTSPLGKATSDNTARYLMALDPLSIGMPAEPSVARIHAVRAFLDVSFGVESDQLPAVTTGVFALPAKGNCATA